MNIRVATSKDLHFLCVLRNDPASVRYSKRGVLSSEVIQKDYLENHDKRTFIVTDQSTPIAYLIFEELSKNSCEISIAIAPDSRGKGYGTKVVRKGSIFACTKLKYDTVVAKIFSANGSSIRIFEKCGYRVVNKEVEPYTFHYSLQLEDLAVVFDFDGVVVDSISALLHSYMTFLHTYNITGTRSEFDTLNGPSLPEIISYFKKQYVIDDDHAEMLKHYLVLLEESYNTIELHSGIEDTLQFLHSLNIPIALATASKREAVLKVLQRYNLQNYFSFIITGDEVTQAKPSPEIYQKVEEHFDDTPLIVIEDSQNGLEAANRAGLLTVHYKSDKGNSLHSNYTIKHFKELNPIITDLLNNYKTIARKNSIAVNHTDTPPEFSHTDKELIEKIWQEKQKEKKLFNGSILSYVSHKETADELLIETRTIEYKQYLAQLIKEELDLQIYPLAVTGIIRDSENCTLIGKRGNVSEYPDHWEFAPAGSIDATKVINSKVDYISQLLDELQEETGIPHDAVKKVTPFALICDKKDKVYDICMEIVLSIPLSEIITEKKSEEYDSIEICPLSALGRVIEEKKCTPTSKSLWANYLCHKPL